MMRRRIGAVVAIPIIAACLWISADATAQPPKQQRLKNALAASGNDKDAREMVEVVMMVRLSRELELTEEETVLLVRRMSEIRGEMEQLHRKRRSLLSKLRPVTQGKSADVDAETIRKSLEDLKALDQRINAVRLDMHEKLSEGLNEHQQARLYLFLQDFEENMRRMVQRVRERSQALEGGRMGRDGAGRGGPPLRMQRDRQPRDNASQPEREKPPAQDSEPAPSI